MSELSNFEVTIKNNRFGYIYMIRTTSVERATEIAIEVANKTKAFAHETNYTVVQARYTVFTSPKLNDDGNALRFKSFSASSI